MRMNGDMDIEGIRYFPIRNYQYEEFFQDVQHTGETLNAAERSEYVKMTDETIAHNLVGLKMITGELERIKGLHDTYHNVQRKVISTMLFTLMTMTDGMVASKYFILADKDIDCGFMRGKLRVILNEGFKKLYGFEDKTKKNSEWHKLISVLGYFPDEAKRQYEHLTSLLEKHSKTSSWWMDERNIETHMDVEKMYASRCEKIIEGDVLTDFLKLIDTLMGVNMFLSNMHNCLNNFLTYKYLRGELKEG